MYKKFVQLNSILLPFYKENVIEAGCDEAGRGALAGPVFAAAVILPSQFYHPLLNDSKQLSSKDRFMMREIIEREAVSFCVCSIDEKTIDSINILKASILAMQRSIAGLGVIPQHLIIDGNRFYNYRDIPHTCIVKGDSKYASIAAASILAKTYRDDFMSMLAKFYPEYEWKKNMGYPTKKHREAIANKGISPHHRLSYKLTVEPTLF